MAIEAVCPENSVAAMSPRISFSHDFCQSEAIPVEQRPNFRSSLNSSIDFDFCVCECFDQESSSADEIFSNGKILPREIKKKPEEHHPAQADQSSTDPALPPPQSDHVDAAKCSKKDRSKEIKASNSDSEEKQSGKSFWGFKRSSSCGSGYTHSLCPLPLLSRSNSTGSTPSVKRTPLSKDGVSQKQNSHKNAPKLTTTSSQCSSSTGYQKPPLKKVVHGSYGNGGAQVNPILNVHSANLFGLGSIFSGGRDRTKKK